jgi:hypothetical protein
MIGSSDSIRGPLEWQSYFSLEEWLAGRKPYPCSSAVVGVPGNPKRSLPPRERNDAVEDEKNRLHTLSPFRHASRREIRKKGETGPSHERRMAGEGGSHTPHQEKSICSQVISWAGRRWRDRDGGSGSRERARCHVA